MRVVDVECTPVADRFRPMLPAFVAGNGSLSRIAARATA
jgi:hypothetical protein